MIISNAFRQIRLIFPVLILLGQSFTLLSEEVHHKRGDIVAPEVLDTANQLQIEYAFYNTIYDIGHQVVYENNIEYAFTDALGAAVIIPYFLHYKLGTYKQMGIGDIVIQNIWNWYLSEHNTSTFKVGIGLPTGNGKVFPNTGNGSLSYVIRWVNVHESRHWHSMFKFEGFITTHYHKYRYGSTLLSHFTFGPKAILPNEGKIYLCGELHGLYTVADTYKGEPVTPADVFPGIPSSYKGSNVFYAGFFFGYKHKNKLIRFRPLKAIVVNNYGLQKRPDYFLAFSVQVAF